MTAETNTEVEPASALAEARQLLPLAEQALTWWDRFAASNRGALFEDRPALIDAPGRALAVVRACLADGVAPAVDEVVELAGHIQAGGELSWENAHSAELAEEAAAAIAVVATPLALVAAAYGLADRLDWQVEASTYFATNAAEELRDAGDERLVALLDELG